MLKNVFKPVLAASVAALLLMMTAPTQSRAAQVDRYGEFNNTPDRWADRQGRLHDRGDGIRLVDRRDRRRDRWRDGRGPRWDDRQDRVRDRRAERRYRHAERRAKYRAKERHRRAERHRELRQYRWQYGWGLWDRRNGARDRYRHGNRWRPHRY